MPPRQRRNSGRSRSSQIAGREEKSLVCFLQALEGKKLVVELRNDTIIRGQIDEVDEYMKWVCKHAVHARVELQATQLTTAVNICCLLCSLTMSSVTVQPLMVGTQLSAIKAIFC